ncbi:D-alanyl-D-alanine carboxypeptidase/D-alanyl-D-alanine-endopeptidase [Streptomyces sp. TS71-3]|uniref:D-alanyl-D-alanine carboxypeptidase/D-alanyl-D-alanine endopeptidase n=1 Tax=Streptomyces sp. TS71-3 TaxID=2733862 RepID=UPI001BB3A607|nr:D-alanyl-D-alanine carboxypeptidase/D-alanyl-D-alanine-endopeptidase [Streptomyces sp. TS71-3]
MTLKTWQVTAGALGLGLIVAAGAVLAAGPWDSSGQRTAERNWASGQGRRGGADHGPGGPSGGSATAPSAPPVLTALSMPEGGSGHAAAGRPPTGPSLGALLDPLLADASLGRTRTAAVVDVTTGRRVYDKGAGQALTPASTTKLATAVAALSEAGADHRISTRAVLTGGEGKAPARVVLVGGGDPTLTAQDGTQGAASLRSLATATARALRSRHIGTVSFGYDDSLYTGPRLHPIGPNENLAPVTALTADEGRLDHSVSGPAQRSTDPSGDAATAFAGFLKQEGIAVRGNPAPARAGRGARQLAAVQSPPLSALVERMLTNSDNDIAEALARQTALAARKPVSFAGGAAAIGARLHRLGLPVAGARFRDGSGLDRGDRLSAGLLTALLAEAGAPDRPELRSVLTGLPVAGFTGTLEHRYTDGADAAGTGLVRAKTGTLTGVNTLAGTVVDADGRVLAFAFMTAGATSPAATQTTLDHLATALAGCGCA